MPDFWNSRSFYMIYFICLNVVVVFILQRSTGSIPNQRDNRFRVIWSSNDNARHKPKIVFESIMRISAFDVTLFVRLLTISSTIVSLCNNRSWKFAIKARNESIYTVFCVDRNIFANSSSSGCESRCERSLLTVCCDSERHLSIRRRRFWCDSSSW